MPEKSISSAEFNDAVSNFLRSLYDLDINADTGDFDLEEGRTALYDMYVRKTIEIAQDWQDINDGLDHVDLAPRQAAENQLLTWMKQRLLCEYDNDIAWRRENRARRMSERGPADTANQAMRDAIAESMASSFEGSIEAVSRLYSRVISALSNGYSTPELRQFIQQRKEYLAAKGYGLELARLARSKLVVNRDIRVLKPAERVSLELSYLDLVWQVVSVLPDISKAPKEPSKIARVVSGLAFWKRH